MIEQISTIDAPGAVGPYSHAIKAGDLVFISGQLPIDPATGEFDSVNVAEQAEQCLSNLQAIAKVDGTELSNTVKTTVLLTDLGDFIVVNRVFASFFSPPIPARAFYEVKDAK
ncbi:Rid family detoxifying hydrolase [Rhizobium leguminosarum]|uniref:Rid family detoxifying hydrolase n=1 Tax=Rhizobium leguminosarum TaxID=384 RepID=UPI001C904324|nr:Rid family detoxifying hydrolase [Rhizobium leguminosarum]MBY2926971.1 RidA family protein [Rhizobium leguminosarum]MBY2938032.1 RidA family protein [Rhizobium leguminosarum]